MLWASKIEQKIFPSIEATFSLRKEWTYKTDYCIPVQLHLCLSVFPKFLIHNLPPVKMTTRI
jgi:hypothetical protein